METRKCKWCKGAGKNYIDYRGEKRPCTWCDNGFFVEPDYQAIIDVITTTRGGNRRIRASKPMKNEFSSTLSRRAYFVWRLARFHGGIDVTMPVMAELAINYDPFEEELDKFAGLVAEKAFGSQYGAASRWGAAMGMISYSQAAKMSSFSTAQEGGPVVIGKKPASELAELW